MDTTDVALDYGRDYPDKTAPEYLALKNLAERFNREYDEHYAEEQNQKSKDKAKKQR